MKNKLQAILTILRAEHYILISKNGYHAVTPKFGHRRYWKESHDIFKLMEQYAENQMRPDHPSTRSEKEQV